MTTSEITDYFTKREFQNSTKYFFFTTLPDQGYFVKVWCVDWVELFLRL